MAAQVDVPASPLLTLQKALVEQMQRLVGEYMKDLYRQKSNSAATAQSMAPHPEVVINIDEEGYPILPDISPTNDTKKADLVGVMCNYLNKHYCTSNNVVMIA